MRKLFIILLVFISLLIFAIKADSFDGITWQRISRDMIGVNAIWVDSRNPKIIVAGTDRGVFRTEDGGDSWHPILSGVDKKVNFIYIDSSNSNLLYAGCLSGLFFSRNQGKSWQRIYQSDNIDETNCLSLIKLKGRELYLGTGAGMFKSRNNGQGWQRLSGELGSLSVCAIAVDSINSFVYPVTPQGVYQIKPTGQVQRVFALPANEDLNESDELAEESSEVAEGQIKHIYINPALARQIYLAANKGIFKSEDEGGTWSRLSNAGLLSKNVRFILVSAKSQLWAATDSGCFFYYRDRWQEVSLRLPMQDVRFLAIDNNDNLYVAGDKGIFRSNGYTSRLYYSDTIRKEPTIQQIQHMAIQYAQIIDPAQISTHQRLARIKAILPEFSLDYDKTIDTYSNSTVSRFTVGPRDWGVTLKWNLADLIWSEQQRLIDSQARLVIKLRQDILDEVTRLYFERLRLQSELASFSGLEPGAEEEKRLKIEELTALIDGLTGGGLSKFTLTE